MRRRHRRSDDFFIVLLLRLIQQISELEYKPPTTLLTIAINLVTFYWSSISPLYTNYSNVIGKYCLNPAAVIFDGEWIRLLTSAFLHVDEYHLYYNMSSLLWKGVRLEQMYGTAAFALLLLEGTLLSHGLYVAVAALPWMFARAAGGLLKHRSAVLDLLLGPAALKGSCAVGFSSVLFFLKVVLYQREESRWSNVMGIQVPVKLVCWVELLLASYLSPRVSFWGHLSGIAAGYLHGLVVEPRARQFWRMYGGRIHRWWREATEGQGGGGGGPWAGQPRRPGRY